MSEPAVEPAAAEVTVLDPALWRDLLAASSEPAFAQAWLGLCCRSIAGCGPGVVALIPSPQQDPIVAAWPAASRADPGLLAACLTAIRAGRGTVQPASAAETRIAYPVQLDGGVIAAAAFDIAAEPGQSARAAMRQVQWASAWLRDWRRSRDQAVLRQTAERSTLALDLLAAALEEEHFAAACRVSATEIAIRFGCERVAIGFSRRRVCQVVGISHTAQFGRTMSLVRQLGAAMDEAIDQHGPMLFPVAEDDSRIIVTSAHAALSAAHGAAHILTIPMFVRDRFVGAVTFERNASAPFDQPAIDLADAVVAILGPALLDKRQLDRPLPVALAALIAQQAVHLFGVGHWGRKLALAGAVLVALFATFARGPYRVDAEARLEGTVQRAMVAPFDGFIAEAAVKAGDTVTSGQSLAVLDDRDLTLERLRWATQRQQHLAEYDQALSQGKRADAARFRAQGEEASAQMQLIDAQLARTRVSAPFDGLIVSGDLSQQIGSPTRRGDVLFELAPLNDYRIVLRVNESQIADIAAGQTGRLLVAALPDAALPFTVVRVTPVAEAHDGKMDFQVDASLQETSPRLRPGMEGLGKIEVGRARLVWIWFRSLLHWVQVQSWAWVS